MAKSRFDEVRGIVDSQDLPTRTRNVLINMLAHEAVHSWPDVVNLYKADTAEFEMSFLRTPGGGRKTLNILKDHLRKDLKGHDHTKEVLWLSPEDVLEARQALNEALHSVDAHDPLAHSLRKLRTYFDARVIHVRVF